MRNILYLSLLAILLSTNVIAQIDPAKEYFDAVDWVSKNNRDQVTIANGLGAPIMIHIIVYNHGNMSAGIEIRNCGTTSHVDPGSAVICMTSDANNPVTFASDSGVKMATGTYQIKQL